MRFSELMNIRTLSNLMQQAEANAVADFEDTAINELKVVLRNCPCPPPDDFLELVAMMLMETFRSGACAGSAEAIRLMVKEITTSIIESRQEKK